MSKLIIPENYNPALDLKQTEKAIELIKETFQHNISAELRLRRVTAPLFVVRGTGINDDLSGWERKVSFPIKDMGDQVAEVVNSLAKWKRTALADYQIPNGYGILTDMNAIRPDEELDNLHSMYVDQWDWERVMDENERNLDFLKFIVRKIYEVMKRVEYVVFENYPVVTPVLPHDIAFIHAEDLQKKYPHLTPKEREHEAAKQYKAIFIIGIGGALGDGKKHDERAPDYDDWTTETTPGYKGLNGDIILWNDVLNIPFEVSSMGIRVNRESLLQQLETSNTLERKELLFHQRLLNNDLPLSIGGGIGQSRICMFLLKKAHIGEVQASIWPDDMKKECREHKIQLV